MTSEKRFVDLDVLIQSIEDEHSWLDTLDDFRELARMQPTVDAVEVMRCKDCKFFHEVGNESRKGCPWGTCRKHNSPCVYATEFCSRGERRDKNAVD